VVGEVVTGTAAAVLVFAAVPVVLIVLVGIPLPDHWTRADVVSLHGLFDLLAVVAWVAWAVCCWQLLRSVARLVRRRDASVRPGAPIPEWLATRIAAAVLAVVSLVGGLSATAGAQPHPRPAATALSATPPTTSQLTPAAPSPSTEAPSASDGPAALATTYTVETGDTLWSIAESVYGDGGDWPAIAQANLGTVMTDGSRFVDPSLILPGWVLTLPAIGEEASPSAVVAPPPVVTKAATSSAPARRATDVALPRHATATEHTAHQRPTAPPSSRVAGAPVPAHQPHRNGPSPTPLPELAALGFGTLAAAAFARRARRARRLGSMARLEGDPPAPVTAGAAETATLLAPFYGSPVLELLESAVRHLGGALAEAETRARPVPRLVVVGPAGVEIRLRAPVGWAPDGWERVDEHTWLRATDGAAPGRPSDAHDPAMPLLVPVGDDARGTWLVPLRAGDVVPVIGPEADAMAAAMQAVAVSWSWAEDLVVTDDPAVAEQVAGVPTWGDDHLLFVGDPDSLSAAALARLAVVTTRPLPATDLTVVIDAQAASLHPLGVTVRPSLLRPAEHAALQDLLGPAPGVEPEGPPTRHANGRRPPRPRTTPLVLDRRPEVTIPAELFPAPLDAVAADRSVEVRLLTAVPRLDGLAEPLDPKRARRATELVAYLALHHPDPVTSDRLRTRVLGSADADAASKTLFNTVGAARRAVGQDRDGRPLLPPASKSGHYRLSALVTTDVTRAEALVAEADVAEDEEEAIALLRAALDLVESEPLAGALTGYGWWAAEGHERRLAATLVDGACRLARLASDHGYLDLARWGLERARLVEPYSELLSRAAMRVAAEAGDAERLRREWVDCQRRVDEIDPGGLPSEATERLYADLRRRVPVHAAGDTES
jgi:DNA-binding SARP family transcriptional activator